MASVVYDHRIDSHTDGCLRIGRSSALQRHDHASGHGRFVADLANQLDQLDLLLAQGLTGAGDDVILPEGFFSNGASATDVPGPDDPLNALNSDSDDQNSADSQSIVQALDSLQPLESQAITEPGNITELDRYQVDSSITTASLSVESGVDTHWEEAFGTSVDDTATSSIQDVITTRKRRHSIV